MSFDSWLTEEASLDEKDEALKNQWETWPPASLSAPENPYDVIDSAERSYQSTRKSDRIKNGLLLFTAALAACLATFLIIGWDKAENVLIKTETYLASSAASKAEFSLPDGTKVFLNKNSKLYYCDDFNGRIRNVRLEGEAYFDVVKDSERPFVVQVKGMSIEVLGTCFTVSAYEDDQVETYLEEGSILARVPERESVILEPNHAIRYDVSNGVMVKFKEAASNHTAWIDGKLEFVNKTLKDIMECLEHWYCIDISCDDMERASEVRLSMTIRQEGVAEIFKALSHITDLSYIIDSKGNVKISF